jgi:hypothetical protein
MLRLTELRLPLDHAEPELRSAIVKRLKIPSEALVCYTVFRRARDARKKSGIALTYTLDVEVRDEALVLRRLAGDRNIAPTPDMSYRFPACAPVQLPLRPLVIGAGPCGLFAALILAQMGFRPIILERGKVVRERTRDTWGLWRRSVLAVPFKAACFGEPELFILHRGRGHVGAGLLATLMTVARNHRPERSGNLKCDSPAQARPGLVSHGMFSSTRWTLGQLTPANGDLELQILATVFTT